jgi:hypothetical protein
MVAEPDEDTRSTRSPEATAWVFWFEAIKKKKKTKERKPSSTVK